MEHKRLVHCDLAARNLLLAENGMIKVADFGLTKEIPIGEECTYLPAGVKLPVRWLALETIKEKEVSHSSDLWTSGVVLWEIYSYGGERYPYGGEGYPYGGGNIHTEGKHIHMEVFIWRGNILIWRGNI